MSSILYRLFTWLHTVHCRLSPKRMAIFAHVMDPSSILLSDHVRLGYKVCTYPGPLDIHNIILKYTVSSTYKASLHSLCPSTCVYYIWDSVCTNTFNTVYKCIVHNVSILCRDASELNSSGESL